MPYPCHYYEPDIKNVQSRMQQRAQDYSIVGNELYKISILGPLIQCLSNAEGKERIREVHAAICCWWS
jgi:hypothetical protein